MIAQGSPSSLKDRLGGDRITLRIREFTPESEVETAKKSVVFFAICSRNYY